MCHFPHCTESYIQFSCFKKSVGLENAIKVNPQHEL